MMVLCAANVVGMLGFYVPIVFSANRAELMGINENKAALLLSIMGKRHANGVVHNDTICTTLIST